jgi:hypothetical protein
LDRSLEIVETSGHFIHCFDKASATHILWTNENNSLFVSRSEEMFVNFVESWFKRSSTTVARSSDEASGPCDSNDISNLCIYFGDFDIQGGDCDTFDESMLSCSLLMLRSAMLRVASFAVCD